MKNTIDYEKNKRDNGGGCSICSSFPIVNVGGGSYWLCGSCVLEAISCLNCGQPKNTFCSKECEDIKMKELNYVTEAEKVE